MPTNNGVINLIQSRNKSAVKNNDNKMFSRNLGIYINNVEKIKNRNKRKKRITINIFSGGIKFKKKRRKKRNIIEYIGALFMVQFL